MDKKTIPRMAVNRMVIRGQMEAFTFASMAGILFIILAVAVGCSRL